MLSAWLSLLVRHGRPPVLIEVLAVHGVDVLDVSVIPQTGAHASELEAGGILSALSLVALILVGLPDEKLGREILRVIEARVSVALSLDRDEESLKAGWYPVLPVGVAVGVTVDVGDDVLAVVEVNVAACGHLILSFCS